MAQSVNKWGLDGRDEDESLIPDMRAGKYLSGDDAGGLLQRAAARANVVIVARGNRNYCDSDIEVARDRNVSACPLGYSQGTARSFARRREESSDA